MKRCSTKLSSTHWVAAYLLYQILHHFQLSVQCSNVEGSVIILIPTRRINVLLINEVLYYTKLTSPASLDKILAQSSVGGHSRAGGKT